MRESGTAKVYTRLRYDIFTEPYFFALPSRDRHKADLKHLIIVSSSLYLHKADV